MYTKIYNSSPYFIKCFMASYKGFLNNKKRYNNEYNKIYNTLIENINYDDNEITNYQRNRLVKLLTECYLYTKYYKDLFDNINCNVDDIKKDPFLVLNKLPILTKSIRKAQVENIVNTNPNRKTISVGYTSGTTGTPTKNYIDSETSAYSVALWERFHKMIGINRSDKHITFSYNSIASQKRIKKPFWVYNASSNQLLMSVFHLKDENLDSYVSKINRFQPQYIDGSPSAIAIVANYINRKNITLDTYPSAICTTAETLFDDQRIEIEKAFNCKVYNQYASSEGSPFITECKFGNMHLHEDSGIFEILDDNNVNIINSKEGLGRMVVTSFRNWKTPLIRYDILDFVELTDNTKSCACGSNFKFVKNVLGRANDLFWNNERGYVRATVSSVLSEISGIEQSQIIQKKPDLITVKLVVNNSYNNLDENLIISHFTNSLSPNIKVSFEYVNSIYNNTKGKIKFILREFEVSEYLK